MNQQIGCFPCLGSRQKNWWLSFRSSHRCLGLAKILLYLRLISIPATKSWTLSTGQAIAPAEPVARSARYERAATQRQKSGIVDADNSPRPAGQKPGRR